MVSNKIVILFLLCILSITGMHAQSHEHETLPFEMRHRGRMYWQMPRRVTEEIGVREGMKVADIGCGDGYFTLFLAEKVGTNGLVYAEDIDASALAILEERRNQEGVENINIIHGTSNDPLLPEGEIDLVLIVNSFHYIEDPGMFFSHIKQSMTPQGKLVIIQWAAEKMDPEMPGWQGENREQFTLRTNLKRIFEAQCEVVEQLDFLPMQYIFICQPAQ